MGGAGAGSEPIPVGDVHGWSRGGASLEVKEDLLGVTREKGGGITCWLAHFHSAEVAWALGLPCLGSLASVGSPHTGCRLGGGGHLLL